MPVEILELIVRAEIKNDSDNQASAEQETTSETSANLSVLDVADQVEELLKRKKER